MQNYRLLENGFVRLLESGSVRLLESTDVEPGIGRGVWSREPGRYRDCPEPGRQRWAIETGRFLTMASPSCKWLGTYCLPSGGKRTFGVRFANMEEIVAGETLSGTPTVAVSPSGPTITGVGYSGSTLLFTVDGADSTAQEYTLSFHAETSGGAVYEPSATLELE